MADEDLKTEEGEEESNRKLAAIMFTDIKGFSKKMGKDEKAAMELLKKHDAMMRVFVAKHGGKVVKVIGDSFMVDFASAVNAVKCAMKVQEYFYKHNEDKSDFEKIEIRIGIHLGDVVVVENDMYGDGVNIASRIEAITEPTRICITSDVYTQIKNKMDIKVYHIGSMELKNIAEPVEVYEILMDAVPAFAQPSETARKAPSKRKVEAATKEEAEEAKAIEVKKQKSVAAERISEADKARLIEEHYKKAEEYYEKGEFEKAEAEINEIYRLDPNRAEVEKRLAEEEQKQETVDQHYKKAEEFFNEGKLDEAEKAVNEIFKIVPLHARAQALLGKIEDKRYEQKEEQRRAQEAKRREEDERREKVESGVRRAKQLMDQFNYREALSEIEAVLKVDSEHVAAKELFAILQEKVQKEDAEAIVSPHAEEKPQVEEKKKEKDAAQLARELAEQQAAAAAAAAAAEEAERRRRRAALLRAVVKYGIRIAAVVGVVAVLYYGVPMAYRALFPNTASIAVISFEGADKPDGYLAGVFPTLLAQDLTGYNHVTVVSPTSSVLYDGKTSDLAKIGKDLNVRQVIAGEVQTDSSSFVAIVRLYDVEKKEKILENKFEKNIASLADVRSAIVRNVLEKLEIDVTPLPVQSPTSNADAYRQYLEGEWLSRQRNPENVTRGILMLRRVVDLEPSFSLAHSALAAGLIQLYRIGEERDRSLLREAVQAAKNAAETDKANVQAYVQLGIAHRHLRLFDEAKRNINKALTLSPFNADSYRELAMFAIVEGDYDKADENLAKAKALDPKNPDTHLVGGLILHFKQSYADAIASYQTSIALGANESVVTTKYLSKAWDALVQEAKTVAFFQRLLEQNPRDYALYYRIGQAYQVTGKVENAKKFLEAGEKLTREDIDANPNDARPHVYRALFLTRLGDPTGEWEKEINAADNLGQNSAEVLYRTANVYAVQKKSKEALAALKKALDLDYSYSEILNSDFSQLSREPEFRATIVRRIKQADLE